MHWFLRICVFYLLPLSMWSAPLCKFFVRLCDFIHSLLHASVVDCLHVIDTSPVHMSFMISVSVWNVSCLRSVCFTTSKMSELCGLTRDVHPHLSGISLLWCVYSVYALAVTLSLFRISSLTSVRLFDSFAVISSLTSVRLFDIFAVNIVFFCFLIVFTWTLSLI